MYTRFKYRFDVSETTEQQSVVDALCAMPGKLAELANVYKRVGGISEIDIGGFITAVAEGQAPSVTRATAIREDNDRLTELLELIPATSHRRTRERIVSRLPDEIRLRIGRRSPLRMFVSELVSVCASYPDGLRELYEAIRWIEGETITVREVENFLRERGLM